MTSKRRVLVLVAGVLLLLGAGLTHLGYGWYVDQLAAFTYSNLGDVREAFFSFRDTNRRWPRTMDEVYGDQYIFEGSLDAERTYDLMSGEAFRCVTEENLFVEFHGDMVKMLVMLPKPYRDGLWPLGKVKTIGIDADGAVRHIAPEEIIELTDKTRREWAGEVREGAVSMRNLKM